MFSDDIKRFRKLKRSRIKILLDVNFYMVLLYRISNYFFRKRIIPLSKFFWLINRIIFTVDLDPGFFVKGGLNIVHGFGIVVGREVRCDGDLTIYQNTTIGGSNFTTKEYKGKTIRQPYFLGNNIVFSNSCVIGLLIINDNSIIAAGSVVIKDVEESVIVAGNPAKVICSSAVIHRNLDNYAAGKIN